MNQRGLVGILVLVVMIVVALGVLFLSSGKNPFSPSKVSAAEIIKRNVANFFKPGTIYHQKTKQYVNEGLLTYEIWEDTDSSRFFQKVMGIDSNEIWQGFDTEIQYEADFSEKKLKKDIYIYANPDEKGKKLGERVDLAKKFDELLNLGILEAKEGKLDNRQVYVVYDTRDNSDKAWDILTFDKETFALLQTEEYGEGGDKGASNIVTYEIQEALSRDEQSFYKFFTEPFVTLEGFRIYERHFKTSSGYVENEYVEVKDVKAGWKTYTNTMYSYAVKHPPHLVPEEQPVEEELAHTNFLDLLAKDFWNGFFVEVSKSSGFEAITEHRKWQISHMSSDGVIGEKRLEPEGRDRYGGIRLEYTIQNEGSAADVILTNGGYYYTLRGRSELLDQILPTFKFIP